MIDDQLELLRHFEQHGSPCAIFTPRPDEAILVVLREAVALGWLKSIAGPTATSGNNLWLECLVLTEQAGRIACGLEPVKTWTKPVDPQRSLFD